MKYYRITLALAGLISIPCYSQQAANSPSRISGKEHPELIDDATAYWHLFRVLGRSQGEPDDMFQRRRLAFAKKTGLAAGQIPMLLAAADTFALQMTGFDGQPVTAALRETRTAAVLRIFEALHGALGPPDAAVLNDYVNNKVKRSIVLLVPAA